MTTWTIGIIGGSGLYQIDALEEAQWIRVNSPFGEASDEILCGRIGPVRVRFLPRHGRGHRIAPGELNARANRVANDRCSWAARPSSHAPIFCASASIRSRLTSPR